MEETDYRHKPTTCPRCLGTGFTASMNRRVQDEAGKFVERRVSNSCPTCHGQKTVHPLRVLQYNIEQAEAAAAFGLPD